MQSFTSQNQVMVDEISVAAAIAEQSKKRKPKANNLTDFCKPYPVEKKRRKATNTSRQLTQPQASEPRNKDPVVQVINGELVLQQQHETANNDDERSLTVVVEEQAATTGIVAASYGDFKLASTGRKSSRWDADETDVFYAALRQVGLDFGTMEAYFEGKRNRRQLKRKYYSELKRHPELVEKAMKPAARVKIDLEVFELTEETVKENIEEEEQKRREEAEQKQAAVDEQPEGNERHDGDVPENNEEKYTGTTVPARSNFDEFADPSTADVLLEEEEEHDEFLGMEDALHDGEQMQPEEEPTLALVHVDKPKKAKAKPRFRSRKVKK